MSVLVPLISRLKILHIDTMELVPFPVNWAQIELLDTIEGQLRDNGRARVIVLKARQLGISTAVQALNFTFATMLENYHCLTLAHEEDQSKHLLGMSHIYWENWVFREMLGQRQGSESALAWDNGSSLRISTARSKGASRGRTFQSLHASEVAFWPDPTATMTGVRQAVPNTNFSVIAIESTANGVGNWFHTTWEHAVAGENEYVPLFFPWHKHPRYKASAINIPYHDLKTLSPEERVLLKAGVDYDSLAWRRWAIRNLTENNEQLFMQEYPSTAIDAFLVTGTNVFPLLKLLAVYRPATGQRGRLMRDGARVRFIADPAGPLVVFSRPSPDKDWGRYVVGADATHTTFGDYAVGQVLNRQSLEQVAVFRDRVDPGTFAEEMFKLALWYNTALLAPEKEGPGQHVIGRILGMNYPNVFQHARIDRTPGKVISDRWGWSTTAQTKHFAVGELLKQVVDGINPTSDLGLTIHDEKTFSEMKNFVTLPDGRYGNANGEDHDDTVMGMAIAVACHTLDGPLPKYGSQDDPYWLPAPPGAELEQHTPPPAAPWEQWEGAPT